MRVEKHIRSTMKALVPECTDPKTGEVNATLLAEETCCALDLYEGDNIPERLFELALEFLRTP